MTIDEIRKTLPNGFHDSFILGINIDYVKTTATFLIAVDLSSPDEEVEITSRNGTLTLTDLLYCVIEPPAYGFTNEFVPEEDKLWLTADSSDFSSLKDCPKLPDPLPYNSFRHWFFISSHNCFIYVAAMHASFDWVE